MNSSDTQKAPRRKVEFATAEVANSTNLRGGRRQGKDQPPKRRTRAEYWRIASTTSFSSTSGQYLVVKTSSA